MPFPQHPIHLSKCISTTLKALVSTVLISFQLTDNIPQLSSFFPLLSSVLRVDSAQEMIWSALLFCFTRNSASLR